MPGDRTLCLFWLASVCTATWEATQAAAFCVYFYYLARWNLR